MGKAKSLKSTSDAPKEANNPIFNKQLGQHILKNPLVAQGIVDKVTELFADCILDNCFRQISNHQMWSWKLVLVLVT